MKGLRDTVRGFWQSRECRRLVTPRDVDDGENDDEDRNIKFVSKVCVYMFIDTHGYSC